MSENKYTVWELIKYVFLFFFHRRKNPQEERNKRFKEIKEELKKEFEHIDTNKKNKKQEDLEKRLNNMFD